MDLLERTFYELFNEFGFRKDLIQFSYLFDLAKKLID